MKAEANKKLVKDVTIFVIAMLIGAVGFYFGVGKDIGVAGLDYLALLLPGAILAGIPFGWRWLSKIFTACSFFAVIVKATLALILGWVAIPVVFISDIVNCVRAEA